MRTKFELVKTITHDSFIKGAVFSKDEYNSDFLFVWGDKNIFVYDIAKNYELINIIENEQYITNIAVNPNCGKEIAVTGYFGSLNFFSITGEKIFSRSELSPSGNRSIVFNYTGEYIAYCRASEVVIQGFDSLKKTTIPTEYPVTNIAFHPYENYLAGIIPNNNNNGGALIVWNLTELSKAPLITQVPSIPSSIRFSTSGDIIVGSLDGYIYYSLNNLYADGEFLSTLYGHHGRVLDLAVSPKGGFLASCGDDHKVNVWTLRNRRVWSSIKDATDTVFTVDFDVTGKRLVSTSKDRNVRIYKVS